MLAILCAHAVAAAVAPVLVRRWGRRAFYPLALVPLVSLLWVVPNWPGTGERTVNVPWVPALSMDGAVFGMQTMLVKPPRAAAWVPVAMVSFADCPGSRRCACKSISPGETTRFFASKMVQSRGAFFFASAPSAEIFPSKTSKSVMESNLFAGSMTRPPVRSNELMGENNNEVN